jgi:hypothetical protein
MLRSDVALGNSNKILVLSSSLGLGTSNMLLMLRSYLALETEVWGDDKNTFPGR